MHALAETAEYVPAAQLPVTAERPVVAQYDPAGQLVHALAEAVEYVPTAQLPATAERPVVAQYDPAVHAEQLDDPVVAWKLPVRQLEQIEAEAVEYVPTAQLPVTAERPVVAQ